MAPIVLGLFLAQYSQIAHDRGVTVYRREHAKEIDVAAEGDIAAPPEVVERILLDYTHHPKWVSHLAESRVLEMNGASLVVYQRLDLPMIDDRDFTLRVTWGRDGQALWTSFATANERGPAPRDHVVRVLLHEGNWRLEPIDGGRATHARYHFRLDLAGSLPGWLGRSRAGKDIPALFDGIRRQVGR
jgi:hypothetical protein